MPPSRAAWPSLSSLAATAKAPPRTTEKQQFGLLASPVFKQSEVKELAEEKQLHGDTLAHAVLEQSRALTSLIGQISQSSSDPLADLGSGGGVGTRGSAGRARLQQELAAQKGVFFDAVVQSMARRMSPTSPTETDHQVLLSRGSFGYEVPRKIRRVWTSEGAGLLDVPDHDGVRLHDEQQWPCFSRRTGPFGCYGGTDGDGQWKDRGGKPFGFTRRPASIDLHESSGGGNFKKQKLLTSCRSKMDHGGIGFSSRDGFDRQQEVGVHRRRERLLWLESEDTPAPKPKGAPKEEGSREGCKPSSRRGGGLGSSPFAFGGQETNLLEQTIDYDTWAICLPRWIACSRTKLWWFLRETFSMGWDQPVSTTATFPLPLPHPGVWRGGGKKLHQLAQRRLLHVVVMALNYHFCGGVPSLTDIRRLPNAWQLSVFERLRSSLFACGSSLGQIPLSPGRSGTPISCSTWSA